MICFYVFWNLFILKCRATQHETHKYLLLLFFVLFDCWHYRNKGGYSHNTGYKTRQRCNRLGQTDGIKEPSIEKRIRRLIAE
jgi:hypothetical protein